MKRLIACLLLSAVAACQTVGADDWCLTNSPRLYSQAVISAMSDEEVEEALSYNEYGAKRCGWKAGKAD